MRPRTAGFTLFETLVALVVMAWALSSAVSVVGTTTNVAADSRARTRVVAEHRRNVEALTNVLRSADVTTLAGFDATGTSTRPTFARASGAALATRTLGPVEELRWTASYRSVDGVDAPGYVVLASSTGTRLVADRVPRGGFRVRQQGRTLTVELTTYYASRERRVAYCSTVTSVTVRN